MEKIKKRILMCGESSHISSGFGNYTKNILSRLYSTNKYEIAELSCYRDSSIKKTEPWRIYPVAVKSNNQLYQQYVSNDSNQYGRWMFEFVAIDFKPHIVFDVRDFWNFTYQETSPLRNFYHWMIAPTYDSAPPKIETMNSFYNADTLCFHTHWAKNNLISTYNYRANNLGPVVNDAIDHNIFKPIEYSKINHKIKHGVDHNSFVIGSVMRNQKRKLIPDLIKTFAKLYHKNKNKNLLLYLHTSYPDSLGWDIPSLLLENNIGHRVLLSYICNKCNKFFPSVFRGPKTVCKFCNQEVATIANVKKGLSETDLNEVYNIFDIYIQYAICEGFGIPIIEAAACGIPVISIGHEAMGEVAKNVGGDLVNIKTIFREQETNADRVYPDNDHLMDIVQKYIDLEHDDVLRIGNQCRQLCLSNYSWDKTSKVFEDIFDSIDISKKISWDSQTRQVNSQYALSKMESHRQLIYEIIDNILQEPALKQTNFVEELIKSANDGYVQHGIKSYPFDVKKYIDLLQTYLNNKASIEKLRINPNTIISTDIRQLLDYYKT